MKKLLLAVVVALGISATASAQTAPTLVQSGAKYVACGRVYPINCSIPVSENKGITQILLVDIFNGGQTVNFQAYGGIVTVTSFTTTNSTQPKMTFLPGTATLTVSVVNCDLSGSGQYNDAFTATITVNYLYYKGSGLGVYLGYAYGATVTMD